MPNSSATGGFLTPTYQALPNGITLERFIQTFIVGVTGISPASSVRPKWQANPPKQPPQPTDIWCSFGIAVVNPDASAYTVQDDNVHRMQRHVEIQVLCSFYGDLTKAEALRDGVQLSQNRDYLRTGNMNVKEVSQIITAPDLIGQRWFKKYDVTLVLVRQVNSSFDVLPFASAGGDVLTEEGEEVVDTGFNANNS